MPTKHRRIAIIRDDEVERALEAARRAEERPRSDAALARELVLRGGEAVESIRAGEWERMLARRFGATPAQGSIRAFLDQVGAPPAFDPANPHPATEILDELRSDRP